MIIQLPVTSDPGQDFVIQLGSAKWELYIRWNDRSGFWTMDITEYNSQTNIVSGVPLLLGCDILVPYSLGNGSLFAYDETGSGQDAGYDDLGSRINLYWFSQDEIDAITATSESTT